MKIAYVNVFVSDLERSIRFFDTTLGLKLVHSSPEHGYASLSAGAVSLGLAVPGDDQRDLVGRHTGIGIAVADLAAEHARLWGGFMALFADPDGNLFYLDEVRAAH
jgi:catechol 2,3-dioxygenase-like lactoylglutathione lyase family enzyme